MVQGVLFERDYHRHIIHGASFLVSLPACSISIMLLFREMYKHMVPQLGDNRYWRNSPAHERREAQTVGHIGAKSHLTSSFKANL